MTAEVRLAAIVKSWSGRAVLDAVDLEVPTGEVMGVLGASGSGKTTLLRIIAGLESADQGTVEIGGVDATDLPPARRDLGVVFQQSALLPHLSVGENIGFGLRARRSPAPEIRETVNRAAAIVGCSHLIDRRAAELSGGERQRVALARALVREPRVVLLDEPLSSLDVHVRAEMRTELRSSLLRAGSTALHVTHDQSEAFAVADRVAVLGDGVIRQVGSPDDLLDRPASIEVATFVGAPRMNLIDLDEVGRAGGFVVAVPEFMDRSALVAGIRPGDVRLSAAETDGARAGVVIATEITDTATTVHVRIGDERVCVLVPRVLRPQIGDVVGVLADSERFHLFDRVTGAAVYHPR